MLEFNAMSATRAIFMAKYLYGCEHIRLLIGEYYGCEKVVCNVVHNIPAMYTLESTFLFCHNVGS